MEISTSAIGAALESLAVFDGRRVATLDSGELIGAQQAAALVRRASEAVLAAVATEVSRRSAPEFGAAGLARSHGFSSPGRMIAHATGGSLGDASHLMDAGRAFAPLPAPEAASHADAEVNTTPETAQAAYPHLAASLTSGEISAHAAGLVARTLDILGERASSVEERLVARACNLDLGQLRRACQRLQASADPSAWEERERHQHQARRVSVSEDDAGMVVIQATLDPPTAAPVVAWLDAQVKDALRRRRDGDPLEHDTRSVGQVRADALVGLARHGMACNQPTSGVSTTVIVRIGLDELRSGSGVGSSDDLTAPVSAGTLRVMAADAEIIPLVLGADSEILDMGRARRLFTRAQRLALVERDGGCAMCHAPPSYCEAHHIRWWDRHRGKTDLDNGVLLCVGCHHRVHRDGWQLDTRDGQVWITAPRSIDPSQHPRLGGQARMQLAVS